MVRLLVLDQSCLLPWVVRHEAPVGVEVEAVLSLDAAERILEQRPPDAAVVSVPPGNLPWRSFQRLCASRRPPVPVLYESCVHSDPRDAGLDPNDGYVDFLPKPAPRADLRAALLRLLIAARRPDLSAKEGLELVILSRGRESSQP